MILTSITNKKLFKLILNKVSYFLENMVKPTKKLVKYFDLIYFMIPNI